MWTARTRRLIIYLKQYSWSRLGPITGLYFVANFPPSRCYLFPDALRNDLSFIFFIRGHNIIHKYSSSTYLWIKTITADDQQLYATYRLLFKCIIRHDESDDLAILYFLPYNIARVNCTSVSTFDVQCKLIIVWLNHKLKETT